MQADLNYLSEMDIVVLNQTNLHSDANYDPETTATVLLQATPWNNRHSTHSCQWLPTKKYPSRDRRGASMASVLTQFRGTKNDLQTAEVEWGAPISRKGLLHKSLKCHRAHPAT